MSHDALALLKPVQRQTSRVTIVHCLSAHVRLVTTAEEALEHRAFLDGLRDRLEHGDDVLALSLLRDLHRALPGVVACVGVRAGLDEELAALEAARARGRVQRCGARGRPLRGRDVGAVRDEQREHVRYRIRGRLVQRRPAAVPLGLVRLRSGEGGVKTDKKKQFVIMNEMSMANVEILYIAVLEHKASSRIMNTTRYSTSKFCFQMLALKRDTRNVRRFRAR